MSTNTKSKRIDQTEEIDQSSHARPTRIIATAIRPSFEIDPQAELSGGFCTALKNRCLVEHTYGSKQKKTSTLKFEVQTLTIADGWINCWQQDGETLYFDSAEAAYVALDQFFDDLPLSMEHRYSIYDYRVVAVDISAPDEEN